MVSGRRSHSDRESGPSSSRNSKRRGSSRCAGGAEARAPDTGTPDAGKPDAGIPEAGKPDVGKAPSSWGAPRTTAGATTDSAPRQEQAGESSRDPIPDDKMMRLLRDSRSWSVDAGAATHLDETDMLFALAKAGGGVHLAECHTCHDEALAIEELVAGSGTTGEERYRLVLAHGFSSSAFNNR